MAYRVTRLLAVLFSIPNPTCTPFCLDVVDFVVCMEGPDQPTACCTGWCETVPNYDYDNDGDVDLADFAAFQERFE